MRLKKKLLLTAVLGASVAAFPAIVRAQTENGADEEERTPTMDEQDAQELQGRPGDQGTFGSDEEQRDLDSEENSIGPDDTDHGTVGESNTEDPMGEFHEDEQGLGNER